MPECHWHRGVETEVSCPECGRYMCPKDMVATPVGYKCRDCARPLKGQRAYVKPRQLVLAVLAAFGVALVGGLALGAAGLGFFYVALLYGVAVAYAARRASGGHRGPLIAAIAGAAAALGALLGAFSLLGVAFAAVGAVGYSLANRP